MAEPSDGKLLALQMKVFQGDSHNITGWKFKNTTQRMYIVSYSFKFTYTHY